jgi:hypothetical protein
MPERLRCVELTPKSPDSDVAACAEALADVARERGLTLSAEELRAYVRRTAEPGSTAHLLLLLDAKSWPAAVCLFHSLRELEGERLWVSELYIRYDDHAGELKAARVLAAGLTAWAKRRGSAFLAGAAEKDDIEMRELARLMEMETRRMVLLSRDLRPSSTRRKPRP